MLQDWQIEQRQRAGLEIAERTKIERKGDAYIVASLTKKNTRYTVVPDPLNSTCTCPDHEMFRKPCKHIYGVRFLIQREQDENALLVAPPKTKRPPYKRNWSAFNAAQMNETYEFQAMLYDLCQTIEEPKRGSGRPPIPIGDALFSAIYKVYSAKSGRRVISQLHEAYERGYLERTIHFNRISSYLEKSSLSKILRDLVVKSSRPLAAVETIFAVDSTGFTGSRFTRWGDVKYRGRKERRWAKLHVMCGVETHVITDAIILGPNTADTRPLSELLSTTAMHFNIREVVADKGYSVVKSHNAIAKIGAEAFIPFKTTATGGRGGLWEKAYLYYMLNREEFLTHYHRRSNVETAIMMMKTKFGDGVRSKKPVPMANEVYAKVVAHNIYCLIMSMYENGITTEFLASKLKKAG
jgi:transposase